MLDINLSATVNIFLQFETKSLTVVTVDDPLTVDEVEAFPPVQTKLKLDTDAKPEGKCA